MADIDIRRTHQLGLAGARQAADRMAGHLKSKFDLRGDWEGDTLRFERTGLNGALAVAAKEIHLTVTLGFLMKAMRGSIQAAIERELDTMFAAAGPAAKAPAKPKATPPKTAKPRPKKGA